MLGYQDSGKHLLLGEMETNGKKLMEASGESMRVYAFDLQKNDRSIFMANAEPLPLKRSLNSNQDQDCGTLIVKSFVITQEPTFLDYVRAGAEIKFMVAVVRYSSIISKIGTTIPRGNFNLVSGLHCLKQGSPRTRFTPLR